MEKIKVNMNPNPLDVQTIHASQNDTEARKWEFELHNNGEVIDAGGITEQMFFKAYKGGTEQLLPENGSTPTTSPFKGDIRYPQGLLSDQEFTYRQSPTEEDGLAKITDIKGNTLVWNQLVDTDTSSVTLTSGHKFITKVNGAYSLVDGTGQSLSVTGGTDEVFDLTKMGVDFITSTDEFTSLFPLSYSYNQGSLLSFNGNGIKTVGKNLWKYTDNVYTRQCTLNNQDGTITVSATGSDCYFGDVAATGSNYSAEKGWLIDVSGINNLAIRTGNNLFWKNYITRYDANKVSLGFQAFTSDVFTADVSNCAYVSFRFGYANSVSGTDYVIKPQVEIGTQSTDFEPYTSSTLSLPISTYFPTGMKSAGNVYDELTESKAITRIGAVDLGTLTWYKGDNAEGIFLTASISNMKYASVATDRQKGILCDKYLPSSVVSIDNKMDDKSMLKSTDRFAIRDTTYTDATAFKTAMSGVYLYYELATPTETSFTTASLVTENAEIPLSNEDGTLTGKCTEQLSENPGFIDAKIKLADSDGECYSNKIQLHVERSPQ